MATPARRGDWWRTFSSAHQTGRDLPDVRLRLVRDSRQHGPTPLNPPHDPWPDGSAEPPSLTGGLARAKA